MYSPLRTDFTYRNSCYSRCVFFGRKVVYFPFFTQKREIYRIYSIASYKYSCILSFYILQWDCLYYYTHFHYEKIPYFTDSSCNSSHWSYRSWIFYDKEEMRSVRRNYENIYRSDYSCDRFMNCFSL